MKFIKLTLLLLANLASSYVFAQRTDTIWYNNKWEKTNEIKARHYFRTTEKVASDHYVVNDFYETRAKQMEGNYSSLNPEIKHGKFKYWFRNGQVQMEATYVKNEPVQMKQFNEQGDIVTEWELIEVSRLVNGKLLTELVSIERAPKFPGGKQALETYLSENLKHISSIEASGKVFVNFKVKPDGSISEVQAIGSSDPLLSREAEKIIKRMPKWEPGKQNGKAITVSLSLPILFN